MICYKLCIPQLKCFDATIIVVGSTTAVATPSIPKATDTTQNYSNKGPTAESNSSDEEDSGELEMTIADTRDKPPLRKGSQPLEQRVAQT